MFKLKAPDGTNNICGKRIAQLRKERKLSQRKLAAKLQLLGYDVDNYFIRRVENGERFITDIELKMFSELFHVPIDELFQENNITE
ncbi:MAG: helix-turn-helix domain-containing protein [Candidatus Ornithomonoglobus sp.]